MNFSSTFIRRPIATTLLTLGFALAGMSAFFLLPVASLPNVDIPTIFVTASMAGASPETMSTSVATPLERHLGSIADVSEMTSESSVGSTRIVLQFGLDRDIDGAARDVQAAISAARADLPASLKSNPTYKKVNPAGFPVLILAMTSDTLAPGQIYDSASTILQQKLSQVAGHRPGADRRLVASRGAHRSQPARPVQIRHRARGRARRTLRRQCQRAERRHRGRRGQIPACRQRSGAHGRRIPLADRGLSRQFRGAPLRRGCGQRRASRMCATSAWRTASRRSWSSCSASRAPTSSRP